MSTLQNRRHFLKLALAGVAGVAGAARSTAADGPLETTSVRLSKSVAICVAPAFVAEELLRAEGFTDIRYVEVDPGDQGVADAKFDFDINLIPNLLTIIDAGKSIAVLTGVMVGCYELFAKKTVRSVAELKGRSVGVQAVGSLSQVFINLIAAYVGLDPARDIRWVTDQTASPMELFAQGKTDAFLGFPPEPQELRARQIGHVIVNTAVDRPWSQYFCCALAGNPEYVHQYPVATKRVLRAILKATDICASDPARAARHLVDRGITPRYDYALQTLSDNGYDRWRDYDAEDSLRFYALRLREVGYIKSSPQKIIANGADWRFLNEIRRELKA